ncbi:hypothetical protein [Nocardia sp. NBC_00511]|uniref:hypothetical protein n=1 Tax=Nocardia sp. NBC_00511 TaxID=2903591 RepID=UPI0030E52BFF
MLEKSAELSPFVADMSERIGGHAGAYATEVYVYLDDEDSIPHDQQPPPPPTTERALLDSFAQHVETVVSTYDPPGIRRTGDSLVFRHMYADSASQHLTESHPFERLTAQLSALLAAEVEFRGPLRLSRTQNHDLAQIYEALGQAMIAARLPAHAALALRRAGGLYRIDEDNDAEDRCGLALAQAKRLAQPTAFKRIAGLFPDLVCGYGYRPFRMLWFVALQLVIFTIAIAFSSHDPIAFTVYKVLVNYLNPLGLGDTDSLRPAARPLYVIECYVGAVTMSVFFALLVRRWFRL